VNREEMRFKKPMHHVENMFPVRFLDSVLGDIREDAVLTWLAIALTSKLALMDGEAVGIGESAVKGLICSRSLLSVLPHLNQPAKREPCVEGSPHVTEGLLVPGSNVAQGAASTSDVALADGTVDDAASQVAIESEETLDVHVKIFADGFAATIPPTHTVNQIQGEGIDRCGRGDSRARVEA
jgi:hypothetical protein